MLARALGCFTSRSRDVHEDLEGSEFKQTTQVGEGFRMFKDSGFYWMLG